MRNMLLAGAAVILAILYVGSRPPRHDDKRILQAAKEQCPPGRNELDCGQWFCEREVRARGLVPAGAVVHRWVVTPLRRPSDKVLVNVFDGEFDAGGQPRYAQCEMAGRTVMAVRALEANPHP